MFQICDKVNLRKDFLNIALYIMKQSSLYAEDENNLVSFEKQNSYTKYRLNNITSVLILNVASLVLINCLGWLLVGAARLLGRKPNCAGRQLAPLDFNLPIILFYLCAGEIFMFLSLQLQNINLSQSITFISLAAGAAILAYYLLFSKFLLAKLAHCCKLKDYQQYLADSKRYSFMLCNITFRKKGAAYYWFALALLKKILVSISISASYVQVESQVLATALLQILFTVYLFRVQPMNKKYLRILTVANEAGLSLVYVFLI